ncbi:hypothetical protein PGTUg99_026338 [Puccinia graminis f. sp. tritici]|uniref:Uncharacterized protein n=1 Tax=Puccinia graminis f. sp. tritici TaxID=56615 RepID=A0A5B0SP04_PUCGR|nr:hypothetical protein PGTUg99_026338 [Puccinia graminis f. sp. tritici]
MDQPVSLSIHTHATDSEEDPQESWLNVGWSTDVVSMAASLRTLNLWISGNLLTEDIFRREDLHWMCLPGGIAELTSSRRGTCTSPAGRISFRSTRYMYLVDWKEALSVSEVRVPRRLEGNPSGRRGTCTSPAGRKPFQPAISSFRPRVSLGIPGYPPGFHGKGASAPESAPASGYPLALAGIRQRIADIRSGLSPPISNL